MTAPKPFAYLGHRTPAPHAGQQGEGLAHRRAGTGAWVGTMGAPVGSGLEPLQGRLKRGRLSRPRQRLVDALSAGVNPGRLAGAA